MQCGTNRSGHNRSGHSLLELVGATVIIAATLVPALRLMRDSVTRGREIEVSNLLGTLAASQLEEHLLLTAANWSGLTTSGDFTADGYPLIHFRVDRSDAVADGGIPGSLISITATVWEDLDGDDAIDAGELQSSFSTKLARIVAYEHEASGP
jgi:hypothetical protein